MYKQRVAGEADVDLADFPARIYVNDLFIYTRLVTNNQKTSNFLNTSVSIT